MKSKILIVLAAWSLTFCTSSDKPGKTESVKVADTFFAAYKADGPRVAITGLMQTNSFVSKQVTDSLGVRLERFTTGLGDFQGQEQVAEASYGDGILHLAYVVKYSRQPVRFNFMFYNPGDGWRIQHFSYEVVFPDELDEAVKAYRIKENVD
jgi:hypothetical protein